MKKKFGFVLAGALVAFLLDPVSGRGRRARVQGWMAPVGRRLRRAKDQVAQSDTLHTARESVAPTVIESLQHVAVKARGHIDDLTNAVSANIAGSDGAGNNAHGAKDAGTAPVSSAGPGAEQHAASKTPEDYRAEVAPKSGIDPIPEGDINDPTLVARVESELFEDATLPKGKLNIDAANGVVTLRGTLDDNDLADDIVERTRAINGVEDVVDLLRRR